MARIGGRLANLGGWLLGVLFWTVVVGLGVVFPIVGVLWYGDHDTMWLYILLNGANQ